MAFRKHPYGAAVVGKEEAALQREVKQKKSNIYGPSVVGDRPQDQEPKKETKEPAAPKPPAKKEPKKEAEEPPKEKEPKEPAKTEASGTQSADGEPKKEAAPKPPPAPLTTNPSAEAASLSLDELDQLLKNEPQLLDRQIDAEFLRAEGPRKGALRAFLAAETKREGGPRRDVMSLLEHALR